MDKGRDTDNHKHNLTLNLKGGVNHNRSLRRRHQAMDNHNHKPRHLHRSATRVRKASSHHHRHRQRRCLRVLRRHSTRRHLSRWCITHSRRLVSYRCRSYGWIMKFIRIHEDS